jgi:hypothetical protein
MKKSLIAMAAVTLALVSFVFSSQLKYETEIFALKDSTPLRISIETYMEKDGWTPVVLSVCGLDIFLWMDASGKVSEMQPVDSRSLAPLFFIDLDYPVLSSDEWSTELEIYEQNEIRIRLQALKADIPVLLRLDRAQKSAEIFLGGYRTRLNPVEATFMKIEPDLEELKLSGPQILVLPKLVYWQEIGTIYSTLFRGERFDLERSRVWVKRIERRRQR